jgi:tetratricopeptide (TPR) repeat protein
MNSDQHKSSVPANHEPGDVQIQTGTDVQATVGYLPNTESIEVEEHAPIALAEGYDALAVELAYEASEISFFDKLRLISLIIVAAVLVIFFFPTERFFKPRTRELGSMTIGGPATDGNLAYSNQRNEPWYPVLMEIDRLYFGEGKLTQAIQVAESALEIVPKKKWEHWDKIHYRYWELLSAAGKNHTLKTASQAYLQILPEDPFANYFYAHAFRTATNRIGSFTPEMKQAYRQEADAIIRQIDSACHALDAQRKSQPSQKEDDALAQLYRKLRLEQARLHALIWKLGGYAEDAHPDVVYRDKALTICDSSVLADSKDAKALKLDIYTHILDRWYWFEGQQVVQGTKMQRQALEQEIKALQKEIKEIQKL